MITLNVAGFVSVMGTFSFTEQPDPRAGISDILIGASGVTAFVGVPNGGNPIGVEITNAELGLVIYNNSTNNTSTYAMYAQADFTTEGLGEITLSGTNLTLEINNSRRGRQSGGLHSRRVAILRDGHFRRRN